MKNRACHYLYEKNYLADLAAFKEAGIPHTTNKDTRTIFSDDTYWPFKAKLDLKRKLEDAVSFTLYFNHEKYQHDGETELTCPELAQKLIQAQMDNHPEHDWYYAMNRKAA